MKVVTLYDASGKIHALFRPSAHPSAPALQFRLASGFRVEHLEVPAELEHLKLGQIHRALRVEDSSGSIRLVRRSG
jgi:hypothetical protein